MDSGYYAACAGLRARAQALDLMASNLANSQTSGYRAQSTVFQSVMAAQSPTALPPLNRAVNEAVNEFGVLGSSVLDLAPGNFEHTGGNLDLAVEGPGFFAVQAGSGVGGGVRFSPDGGLPGSAKRPAAPGQRAPVVGGQGPRDAPTGQGASG